METYSIMPEEWDYDYTGIRDIVKKYWEKKIFCPCEINDVVKHSGCIGQTTRKDAILRLKSLKEKFPFIKFSLFEGQTWGSMNLVQQF